MPDANTLNKLLRLSGMAYKSGWYSPQEWEQKTGINPLTISRDYITYTRSGLCIWTEKAEQAVTMSYAQVESNWKAIGTSNK